MEAAFNIESFKKQLNTQWLGQSVCYFDELDSTNTYVKKLPAKDVQQGMLCLTDNQRKGRGQYERKWESKKAENLTFSIVFKPQTAARLHVLTLACAWAVVEQLAELKEDKSDVFIKWPNDVMFCHKKVAGLLTETVFNGNKIDRLIIGIGLNINQSAFTRELQNKATSIYLETRKKTPREAFLAELLGKIEYKYHLWNQHQPGLLKAINRNINGYGNWIGIQVNGDTLEDSYKLLGINDTGKLLLLNHDGGIESFAYEQIKLITG